MTNKEVQELLKQLLALDSQELGVFISLLANEYIKNHNITKNEFINSLSNSIDKLSEEQND